MMASYKKLNDGSWGLRGPASELKSGTIVMVVTKAGESKTEIVGRIVWTDGVTVLATKGGVQRDRRHSGSPRGRRTGCACGSREGEVQDTDCRQCRFDELDM